MVFSWDNAKAKKNLAKHGVPFAYAARVFDDPYRVEREDRSEDYAEDRYQVIGMVDDMVLLVSFTYRDEDIHIISARKAMPNEKRVYHEV